MEIAQTKSPFVVLDLLQAGGTFGLLLVAFGVLLTLWGLANLTAGRSRAALVLQAASSLVPALLGVAGICWANAELSAMATAPVPPKAAVFYDTVQFSMACGIAGTLATVIPAALGIAALAQNGSADSHPSPSSP